MQRYTTKKTVCLYSGILDLTPQQASSRLHCMDDLGEGLYQIKAPVQFKAGEEIGYDGDLSKELAESVEADTDQTEKPSRNRAKKQAPVQADEP